ncbi:MAG TPA: HDOD domain-containing protein [Steroidobacteraceae bacterium]|nr:HDOD domain-containing protein [Steroidobacteraceae bacterium]
MVIALLAVGVGGLVIGVGGLALRPVVLRVLRRDGRTAVQHAPAVEQMPAELQHLEPPVLPAAVAPVQTLEPAEIFQRLRELELGVAELGEAQPEHDHIVADALAAIGDVATQRRYAPRRPNLLPQLMRAINDDEVSRRELAAIIAHDPSLVGSLLKMANSAFYRVTSRPVESIERAVVILGSDGLRSLMTAALMQPIFQVSATGAFGRFPELVWEHALRSAHAAIPHAALVERADPFAAELLSLVSGLAEIVIFRAAMDYFANTPRNARPDPLVIASLLESQSAAFAWRIGADWELSELMLAALEEQMIATEPTTPLGRSLRFGRCAGALAVLHTNAIVDDETVRLSLPAAGLSPAHLRCMWSRLLNKHEDPRLQSGTKNPARVRLALASAA